MVDEVPFLKELARREKLVARILFGINVARTVTWIFGFVSLGMEVTLTAFLVVHSINAGVDVLFRRLVLGG